MFTVKFDDNGSFTDYSLEMENYLRDTAVLPVVSATSKLYIGLYKPFDNFYIEFEVPNTNTGVISYKYYNGTAFTELSVDDRTKHFTRSGFNNFTKPSDWSANEVDSTSMHWIELSFSADMIITTELSGINIVFSDDTDLIEKSTEIERYKGSANSFIGYHQGARNDIIQELRNSGKIKLSGNIKTDITAADILDPDQLRSASKYLALKEIYFDKSDSVDDKYFQKYADYSRRAQAALNLYLLNIDSNDDGEAAPTEQGTISYTRITRP